MLSVTKYSKSTIESTRGGEIQALPILHLWCFFGTKNVRDFILAQRTKGVGSNIFINVGSHTRLEMQMLVLRPKEEF